MTGNEKDEQMNFFGFSLGKSLQKMFRRKPISWAGFFCMLVSALFLPRIGLAAEYSAASLARQLINKIDKVNVQWVDSAIEQYRVEICGMNYPPMSKAGFDSIKDSAERMTGQDYSFSELPKDIGIDFSSYQNLTEEIFFDSLIRARMDRYSCREAAMECLNQKKINSDLAEDFVDRLTAFRIYRDKYRNFDPDDAKTPEFTQSEKMSLQKYFPTQNFSVRDFFREWDPISAISVIVNYSEPSLERGFLFQETFASMAQDEKMMANFGNLKRSKQIETIRQLIVNTSASQKKTLFSERDYWARSCRAKVVDSDPGPAECFYRPTYMQKRKLLNEYAIASLFDQDIKGVVDPLNNLKNYSRDERAFLCQLNIRYGKGGVYFDAKMNSASAALAVLPPMRVVFGAVAARNLTFALLAGFAESKIYSGVIETLNTVGKLSAVTATAGEMKNIYDKCSASKFKSKQPFPYANAGAVSYSKSRYQFLRECRSCKIQPKFRQEFDISCVKAATSWVINSSLGDIDGYGNIKWLVKLFAGDNAGQTPITKKLLETSDAISVFFYNLTLTTSLEVPSLSDFTTNTSQH